MNRIFYCICLNFSHPARVLSSASVNRPPITEFALCFAHGALEGKCRRLAADPGQQPASPASPVLRKAEIYLQTRVFL